MAHLQASRTTHTFVRFPVLLLVGGLLAACSKPAPSPAAAPPPPPPPPPAEHVPPPVEEEPELASVQIIADAGFSTPESIVFDKKRDVYLVSNINGAPLDEDGNGFISKITPEGRVTAKFIDGSREGTILNAPKGLTISGDTLYVADIDHVRLFDAQTGVSKGEIKIPGATFLNGLATGKDGVIYVSDTGRDKDLAPNGTDAVYSITDDKPKVLIKNKSLGGPNGLSAGEGGVWVTSFGSGELYWISDAGKKEHVQKMPRGKNDGLVVTKDGRILVSSWEGSAVFSGTNGGTFQNEISGVESPADIGYDCERERLLIPLFKKDSVVLQKLSPPSPAAKPATDK